MALKGSSRWVALCEGLIARNAPSTLKTKAKKKDVLVAVCKDLHIPYTRKSDLKKDATRDELVERLREYVSVWV